MESVQYLHKRFLIQKQQVNKYRTKHFPSCDLFILYLLRFLPSKRFSPFIWQSKCQVMFSFHLMSSTLWIFLTPGLNIFHTECLPCHQSTLQLCLICFPCLGFFSFQTFTCLVKCFVVDNAYRIFAFFKTFLASSFCLRNSLKPSKLTFLFCSSQMYFLMGIFKAINLFKLFTIVCGLYLICEKTGVNQ